MAYVGAPFEHDIFVSYSHGADKDGTPYLRDWSVAFVRELEAELRADREYRNALNLFVDADHRQGQGVDPMEPLTPQLKQHIEASGVLMVLMSADYQSSTWCAQERDWWFARQAERGLTTDGRVAVVRIWPTTEAWPAVLKDSSGEPLVGFKFWSGEGRAARPIGWTRRSGPLGTDFNEALLDVVARLYRHLDDLKARADLLRAAQDEAARLSKVTGQTLYLHGRVEQSRVWEHAADLLQQTGFTILPGEPDPVERDPTRLEAIRERRVEMLSACDALLLLGTDDGRAIDADLVVVGKHDRQSARARSNRLLPCALLDTAGGVVATAVRRNNARIVQAEWLDATEEQWTPSVQRWLSEKSLQAGAA